ncbi:hypothetical protein HDU83_005729 [Entophlyctis luteolus]|nr:hypothetical protein HDU83_005729 [Entophlyctis luteolus]KAJ3381158.1 hypothetical protein HDU84_005308 [Entophlyctis sp. JEL0112]
MTSNPATSSVTADDGRVIGFILISGPPATDARPLVMLNGLSSLMTDWMDFARFFANSRSVLLIDHRGMGASAFDRGDIEAVESISLPRMARDVVCVTNSVLGADCKFDMLGFSMGGFIALHIVLDQPVLVSKLVLMGTAAKSVSAASALSDPALVMQRVGESKVDIVARLMRMNVSEEFVQKHPQRFGQLCTAVASGKRPQAVILAQLKAMAPRRFNLTGRLGAVGLQTLVVHGTGDRIVPAQFGDALASGISGARYLRIDGGGHLVHEDDGERGTRVCAAVTAFLNGPGGHKL